MKIADFAPAKRSKGRISSRPSTLIRQVVHDMRRVLRMKSVRFRMNTCATVKDARTCEVCAAGALVLCRWPRSKLDSFDFLDEPDQRAHYLLESIDDLRTGLVSEFLMGCLKAGHRISPSIINAILVDTPERDETLRLTTYPSNTEVRAWCVRALKLAKRLKASGH